MKRPKLTNKGTGAGFGPAYDFMRFTGACCNWQFYRQVGVTGGEDIPKEGPVILVSTHFATLMDTSLLSEHMPHRRKLHYWAKRECARSMEFRGHGCSLCRRFASHRRPIQAPGGLLHFERLGQHRRRP